MTNASNDNNNAFQPIFRVTPVIHAQLDDIERNAWLIERMLIMPKHEAWIRRDVNVARAASTTRIEGASMDEAEVGELIRRGPAGSPTQDDRDNLNAIRAYEFIDYLSDQPEIPITELVVREINRQFISGAAETLTPGVYRRGQNMVGDRYRPPDQGDVPAFMREFTAWLATEDDVSPMLRAGIAHIELAAIHPFWDGNGRTARGLAALVMQRSPLHFRKLLSFEVFMANDIRGYFDAIETTLGAQYQRGYDATAWLEYFCGAIWFETQRLAEDLTDWHRMIENLSRQGAGLALQPRQIEALAYAVKVDRLTRGDYIEIASVSPETASRDLAKLVALGLLKPHGQTRSRYYTPVTVEDSPPPPEQLGLPGLPPTA